jgi:DNA polymerase IV
MILHVDMDAFYASVEQRDRPELAGKAVIVGGNPAGRGVVSAANYEARKFGVHSAMPSATARRKCPHAVFLPPRIGYYTQVSREIREIFVQYTPLVEPLSLDEAFLDVSGSVGLFGSPVEMGRKIKEKIHHQTKLVASVGVAPNKYLAKVASDLDKPDGFVVVSADKIQEFLDPLPVARLWGVGRVSNRALERLNIRTIAQLRRLPQEVLGDCFGTFGEHLWRLAHGIDDRPVIPDREAKSISHETTFEIDVSDRSVQRARLMALTEQVARRVREQALRARTVHLKVRFADFRTITRSHTFTEPTNLTDQFWHSVVRMFETDVPTGQPVRLLGMGASGFDALGNTQQRLFDEEERCRLSRLDSATDQITARFGKASIGRATKLQPDP